MSNISGPDLLDIRDAAIRKVIDELGGESPKAGDGEMDRVFRSLIISCCKEAAGKAFDIGYKLEASW